MSRKLTVLALLSLALGAGSAEAAEGPALARLTAKAEACIRTAIPSVERAEPSLKDGVEFIVGNLCVVEIGRRARFIQNTTLIETMKSGGPYSAMFANYADEFEDSEATPEEKARMAKLKAAMTSPYDKAQVDPDTGEIIFPEGSSSVPWASAMTIAYASIPNQDQRFRALAADLLLSARLAHRP